MKNEFYSVSQSEGDATVDYGDGKVLVPRDATLALLQTVLCAIKQEGDREKLQLAAKIARSWLPL